MSENYKLIVLSRSWAEQLCHQTFAILKTVFRATIIVAGTNKANNAENVDETVSPIPIPIKEPVTLSIPNLLTITKIAPAIKNVCESFPEATLIENPTNIPSITNIA